MSFRQTAAPILLIVPLIAPASLAADRLPLGVACLLEDNGEELLPKLTNPQGDLGEGEVEKAVVFSGSSAIKITNYQRYFNLIPGWAYRIVENPKEGEYRYLRFAWKAEGLAGIMLQLHDDRDWNIRYVAGANKFGWAATSVAESPPQVWTIVTVDLFKDFGEREIHGIALTAFDQAAGYFDHIYLARTIAELDAIDATGLDRGEPIELKEDEIEQHRQNLASNDAAVAYRAFWTLAAGGESVRASLTRGTDGESKAIDAAQIAAWLRELDYEEYTIRERATAQLKANFAAAQSAIEAELKRTESLEVRRRLETIVAAAQYPLSDAQRIEQQAQRIVRIIDERAKRRESAK